MSKFKVVEENKYGKLPPYRGTQVLVTPFFPDEVLFPNEKMNLTALKCLLLYCANSEFIERRTWRDCAPKKRNE